jgi:nuclear pore complex protein Nup54
LFSQPSQNQQQRPSLFGNLGQSANPLSGGSTLGTSTLGTSNLGTGLGPAGGLGTSTLTTNSLLSTRGAGVPAVGQADAHAQQAKLMQRMEGIKYAWNTSSPQCRFQVRLHPFFYF